MNKPPFKRRRSNLDETVPDAKKICGPNQMTVCFDCSEIFESRLSGLKNHICGYVQSKVVDGAKIKQCIEILNSKLKLTPKLQPPICPPCTIPPPPPLPPPVSTLPSKAINNKNTSTHFAVMDGIQKGTTLRKVSLTESNNPIRPSTEQQSKRGSSLFSGNVLMTELVAKLK